MPFVQCSDRSSPDAGSPRRTALSAPTFSRSSASIVSRSSSVPYSLPSNISVFSESSDSGSSHRRPMHARRAGCPTWPWHSPRRRCHRRSERVNVQACKKSARAALDLNHGKETRRGFVLLIANGNASSAPGWRTTRGSLFRVVQAYVFEDADGQDLFQGDS